MQIDLKAPYRRLPGHARAPPQPAVERALWDRFHAGAHLIEAGLARAPRTRRAKVACVALRMLEVVMPAPANAIPLDVDRAGEPRQAVARSVQDRWHVSEFDKCEIAKFEIDKSKVRPDAPPYNHRGTVVVASVWLALYVIVVIYHFIAATN